MLVLNTNPATTMTSREMAELTEKRHDSVKRTIETLESSGVISNPQFVDGIKAANGVTEKVYLLCKRDSIIVVAQLCPEFTAKLVDRWQELESKQTPAIPQTYAAALLEAGRLAQINEAQAESIARLEHKIDESSKWASVKRMEAQHNLKFNWRELKNYSERSGYDMPKVMDSNYPAGVNTYHEDVWMEVYQVEIPAQAGVI